MDQFLAKALKGGLHFLQLGLPGLGIAVHVGPNLFRIDAGETSQGGRRDDSGIVSHQIFHVPVNLELVLVIQPVRIEERGLSTFLLHQAEGFPEFIDGFSGSISASEKGRMLVAIGRIKAVGPYADRNVNCSHILCILGKEGIIV